MKKLKTEKVEELLSDLQFKAPIKELSKSLHQLLMEWFLSDYDWSKEERHTMIHHYTALTSFLNGLEKIKTE